jgi:hypothetical protein
MLQLHHRQEWRIMRRELFCANVSFLSLDEPRIERIPFAKMKKILLQTPSPTQRMIR